MRNIWIEEIRSLPIEIQENEFVERKGIGHPDSIADGLAESVSRALSNMYIARYGRILHHNTDEAQIVGGQAHAELGAGTILEPTYILLVGRAVTTVGESRLPYRRVAIKGAREYLSQNFHRLDVDSDIMLDCRIGQSSLALRSVYDTQKFLANDTSFGIGYAPLSESEKITLEVEHAINGELKSKLPEVGEDVKVMSVRHKDDIDITVAAAMIGPLIPDLSHYISIIEELRGELLDITSRITNRNVKIAINTADDYDKKVLYLTVTGLSMENADDGSVGRGNRVNGLITPNRPMSMEASAGKNPITHVGKLYNICASQMADEIVKSNSDILEARVRLVSQIGKPIDRPLSASAQLILTNHMNSNIKNEVSGIIDNSLENIGEITKKLVRGEINVF